MAFYSNYQPGCITEATANWLASIRDTNGVPATTVESILEVAEEECNDAAPSGQATEEDLEEARYDYLRFAGVSEDFAGMYRSGLA